MLRDICQKITFRRLVEIGDATDITFAPFTITKYKGRLSGYIFYRHQLSINALHESQLDGCHLCALLWFALEEYGSPSPVADPRSLMDVWLWCYNWPAGAEVKRIEVVCQRQTTTLDVLKSESISPHSS
jgi:hypothetical protein